MPRKKEDTRVQQRLLMKEKKVADTTFQFRQADVNSIEQKSGRKRKNISNFLFGTTLIALTLFDDFLCLLI